MYMGGYTLPYDISIVLLCIGFVLMWILWPENYGGVDSKGAPKAWDAWLLLLKDPNCRRLCIVATIFEGSMFVFVSNWTPALDSQELRFRPFISITHNGRSLL